MQNKGKTLKNCGLSLYSYKNIKSCQFSSTCISQHSHANPTLLSIHISCCKKLIKCYRGWMHAHKHPQPTMCMHMKMYICKHTKKGWGRKQINVTFHNTMWVNNTIKKVNQLKFNNENFYPRQHAKHVWCKVF